MRVFFSSIYNYIFISFQTLNKRILEKGGRKLIETHTPPQIEKGSQSTQFIFDLFMWGIKKKKCTFSPIALVKY